jgi:hypothetical protein
MRAKEYAVLEMAVEQGVTLGWQHAHKHVDSPGESAICDQIVSDVLNEICEWFTFADAPEEEAS